jgi:hypothetical protein
MKGALLLALTATLTAQDLRTRSDDLLKVARPLRVDEISWILTGVRAALAGRTVRIAVAPDGPGPDILFGVDGRPRIVRTTGGIEGGIMSSNGVSMTWHTTVEAIDDYTGTPARGCDGAALDGELVVEYRNENNGGWKATARAKTGIAPVSRSLVMLSPLPEMESGGMKTFGERKARAVVAPWMPPHDDRAQPTVVFGDPFPNVRGNPPRRAETVQKLWIDVDSLLPLEWESPVDALAFRYDPAIAITRPEGIVPPTCVP